MNVERPRWSGASWSVVFALFFIQAISDAATLQPESLSAWKAYTQAACSRLQQRIQVGGALLRVDEMQGVTERLRTGETVIFPVDRTPQKVPDALIHDWVGVAFIPNVTLDDMLATVRNYSRYSEFYHPAVAESKLLRKEGLRDKFSMLLVYKSAVSEKALDGDFESQYVRLDERRWYSISESTRLQEIDNYGSSEQRLLPQNEGSGLIWRLFSITRFEERDGGVYIELEAIALSREIPPSLRWVAAPIVRHISKNSMSISLHQTSRAVYARTSMAQVTNERNASSYGSSPANAHTASSFH